MSWLRSFFFQDVPQDVPSTRVPNSVFHGLKNQGSTPESISPNENLFIKMGELEALLGGILENITDSKHLKMTGIDNRLDHTRDANEKEAESTLVASTKSLNAIKSLKAILGSHGRCMADFKHDGTMIQWRENKKEPRTIVDKVANTHGGGYDCNIEGLSSMYILLREEAKTILDQNPEENESSRPAYERCERYAKACAYIQALKEKITRYDLGFLQDVEEFGEALGVEQKFQSMVDAAGSKSPRGK